MRVSIWIAAAACAVACAGAPDIGAKGEALTSPLWGEEGEAFAPGGRLVDWSYAGYGAGERPIPDPGEVTNVRDFGAVGDGVTDDGAAFEAAIDAAVDAGGGAVMVPEGRYLLRRRLTLERGVVLRGAGRDATVLYFPEPLTELYGGDYSFTGGFIEAVGSSTLPLLTSVVDAADRGTRALRVADASEISVGDWVLLQQTDVDGTLMRRLHDDQMDGGTDNIGDVGMRFPSRVSAVEGDVVTLERALMSDVETRWAPTLYAVEPALSEAGVESLTLEFPVTTYPGHFDELGYNGIYFRHVWNGWVRDVTVLNADYGVSFTSSFFCTATGVHLDTTGDRGELTGHHGLNNGHGGDNLFIDFDIRTTFVHDLTNEWYAHGVVFARGRGDDLCMDHHRAAPFATLWTELDVGAGTRPWRSGGSSNRGPHTASYDTTWNVSGDERLELPPASYGPTMTFVGLDTHESIPEGAIDWYLEGSAADPADLIEPRNLWMAMRERRLGSSEHGADGGSLDGGPMDADGGSDQPDAGDSDATIDAGAPPTDVAPGGCGCRVTTRSGGSSSWLFLMALVAGLPRRRRRAVRATSTPD